MLHIVWFHLCGILKVTKPEMDSRGVTAPRPGKGGGCDYKGGVLYAHHRSSCKTLSLGRDCIELSTHAQMRACNTGETEWGLECSCQYFAQIKLNNPLFAGILNHREGNENAWFSYCNIIVQDVTMKENWVQRTLLETKGGKKLHKLFSHSYFVLLRILWLG